MHVPTCIRLSVHVNIQLPMVQVNACKNNVIVVVQEFHFRVQHHFKYMFSSTRVFIRVVYHFTSLVMCIIVLFKKKKN